MSATRIVLLVVLSLLLAVAFLPCQTMMLAQRTVVSTAFLLPHVEQLFAALRNPATHEQVVRWVVHTVERQNGVRIPADMNEKLMEAAVTALSTQWIQDEMLQILNKTLAVLRGTSKKLQHTIYISRRKDVLLSELARRLPPEQAAEVQSGGQIIPDSVDLVELVGRSTVESLQMMGRRYVLFSLLFIWAIPAVLVLLCVQVGKIGWGISAVGAAALVAGLAFLVAIGRAGPYVESTMVRSLVGHLPQVFRWVADLLSALVKDAVGLARRIATVFVITGTAAVLVGQAVRMALARASH